MWNFRKVTLLASSVCHRRHIRISVFDVCKGRSTGPVLFLSASSHDSCSKSLYTKGFQGPWIRDPRIGPPIRIMKILKFTWRTAVSSAYCQRKTNIANQFNNLSIWANKKFWIAFQKEKIKAFCSAREFVRVAGRFSVRSKVWRGFWFPRPESW